MDETCFVHFVPDVAPSRVQLGVIEGLLSFIVGGARPGATWLLCIVNDL